LSEGNLPTRFFCFLPDNDIGFDFEFFQGHNGYALRWRDEEKEERVDELYQQISTHVFQAPTFTTPPASRPPESTKITARKAFSVERNQIEWFDAIQVYFCTKHFMFYMDQ
jgi:hypothetical protein